MVTTAKASIGAAIKKLKAYISFKQIDKLKISGACDVFITGVLKADNLVVNQSGASDLKGKVEVNKMTVDLLGASDITISGTAAQSLWKPAVPVISGDMI